MSKLLMKSLLVLLFVPSLLSADVVGKGLKCEGDFYPVYHSPAAFLYFNTKDHGKRSALFFFFDSKTHGKRLDLIGSEVVERSFSYRLEGPNIITFYKLIFSHSSRLNRESLVLTSHNFKFTCTGYNSIESVKMDFRKLADDQLKKNKF